LKKCVRTAGDGKAKTLTVTRIDNKLKKDIRAAEYIRCPLFFQYIFYIVFKF